MMSGDGMDEALWRACSPQRPLLRGPLSSLEFSEHGLYYLLVMKPIPDQP